MEFYFLFSSLLSVLPLAGVTDNVADPSIRFYPSSMPPACEQSSELVKLCAEPHALFLKRKEYDELVKMFGKRKTPMTQLRSLRQIEGFRWRLTLEPHEERPLIWIDVEHPHSLRLWPVSPQIKVIQSLQTATDIPIVEALGSSSIRIRFPEKQFPSLASFEMTALNGLQFDFRFEPLSKNSTLLIDAGHGGLDSGASVGKLSESNINFEAATLLANKIRGLKNKVVLSRSENQRVSLEERFEQIQKFGAKLLISIHSDAIAPHFANAQTERAACYFFRPDLFRFAQGLCDQLRQISGRKVAAAQRSLFLLKSGNIPSILIEIFNLSDPADLELLKDPKRRLAFLEAWASKTANFLTTQFYQSK